MKKYIKMDMTLISVAANENISSNGLSDWLEGSGDEYFDAGITTYIIES